MRLPHPSHLTVSGVGNKVTPPPTKLKQQTAKESPPGGEGPVQRPVMAWLLTRASNHLHWLALSLYSMIQLIKRWLKSYVTPNAHYQSQWLVRCHGPLSLPEVVRESRVVENWFIPLHFLTLFTLNPHLEFYRLFPSQPSMPMRGSPCCWGLTLLE